MSINFESLEKIIDVFEKSEATSFYVRDGKERLQLKKNICSLVSIEENTVVTEPIQEVVESSNIQNMYIEADRVGTFYSAAPPDSSERLKVGDFVKKGKKIGNISSVDVVYEIIAPYDMEIIDILVSDTDMVEYGQAIFEVVNREE